MSGSFNNCRRKVRITNAFNGLIAAWRMQRKNPYARIVLYPCKFCQGWHIGNAFNRHEAKRSFNRLTKMMSHPNFLIKVPEEIRGHLLYKREQMEGFLAQKKRELYS